MTNAELIRELCKYPADAIVMSIDSSGLGCSEIIGVEFGIADDIHNDDAGTFDFFADGDQDDFPPAASRITAINLLKTNG